MSYIISIITAVMARLLGDRLSKWLDCLKRND